MTVKWFVARDQKKLGPYSTEQIAKAAKDGKIRPTDMVLMEGETAWRAASTVNAFFPPQQNTPPPLPPLPPPIPIEAPEWYYTQNGTQTGPVTWSELRKLAASGQLLRSDFVWKAGMSAWSGASEVDGLLEAHNFVNGVPARMEATTKPLQEPPFSAERVSCDIRLGGCDTRLTFGGDLSIQLDGERVAESPISHGINIRIITKVGHHTLTFRESSSTTFASTLGFAPKGPRPEHLTLPITFDRSGHYVVNLRFVPPTFMTSLRHMLGRPMWDITLSSLKHIAPQAHEAVAFRTPKDKAQLCGIWTPVSDTGDWFIFTDDYGMLRADGFGMKYRWVSDDKIELYADDTKKTVIFTVLSLGEYELILKLDDRSVHFRKTQSITDTETKARQEEARRRRAETIQNFKNAAVGMASVLAAGGFAVLCVGAGVGLAAGGGGSGRGEVVGNDVNSGLVRCKACGGQGVTRHSLNGGTRMAEYRCSVCDGKGWKAP